MVHELLGSEDHVHTCCAWALACTCRAAHRWYGLDLQERLGWNYGAPEHYHIVGAHWLARYTGPRGTPGAHAGSVPREAFAHAPDALRRAFISVAARLRGFEQTWNAQVVHALTGDILDQLELPGFLEWRDTCDLVELTFAGVRPIPPHDAWTALVRRWAPVDRRGDEFGLGATSPRARQRLERWATLGEDCLCWADWVTLLQEFRFGHLFLPGSLSRGVLHVLPSPVAHSIEDQVFERLRHRVQPWTD